MLPPKYDRDVHHLISKVSHMCRPNKISVHSNFSSDFTVFSSGRGRERNSASSSHNLNRLIGANLRLSICSQKKTRESKRRNAFGGKMIGYSKIRKNRQSEWYVYDKGIWRNPSKGRHFSARDGFRWYIGGVISLLKNEKGNNGCSALRELRIGQLNLMG